MCGITGFLSAEAGENEPRRTHLLRMTSALKHRGPNAEGNWQSADGRVNFGHRRLSIIDLSASGSQPMTTPDGRFTLSYNGEIYNYQALRTELVALGYRFNGSSDTEVLLYALERWGVERALARLNGMFAFSLWDARENELHLARDRFGEKPLYYAWNDGTLLFGSELKALAQHPSFRREIDHEAVALFMRFNYVPWPYCIFKGSHKLPPGHFLRIRAGEKPGSPQPYWSLQQMIEKREPCRLDPDDPALIDLLDTTMRKAVKLRMVADVPLGAFLSGGIDSSTVVALMQAQSAQPVKTFTIGFWATSYNEAEDAARVARHLGTEHHEYYLSSRECFSLIGQLPEIYDEPFADSSQIPTTLISQFTRKHVTVALSGDAGDEFFGGYNRYIWGGRIWPKLSRVSGGVRSSLGAAIQRVSPNVWEELFSAMNGFLPSRLRVRGGSDKLHKLALALGAPTSSALYSGIVSQWQNPGDVLRNGKEPSLLADVERSAPATLQFVERMMYLDIMTYMTDDILCKVDRASMSAGLEARIPFLDNDLVSLAWSLPIDLRIHKGVGKWPLRQVLKRYVPEKLFERPKTGFGVPVGDWLRGPLRDWAEEMLSEDRLTKGGYFRPEVVRKQWAEHLSGRFNRQHSLWSVLMFEAWRATWELSKTS
jgi:asparagine synthase (glutamine-hydrolysing)